MRAIETFLAAKNERPSLFSHTHIQTWESVTFTWAGILIRSLHSRSRLGSLQPQTSEDFCIFPRVSVASSFLTPGSSLKGLWIPLTFVFPFSHPSGDLSHQDLQCDSPSMISSRNPCPQGICALTTHYQQQISSHWFSDILSIKAVHSNN